MQADKINRSHSASAREESSEKPDRNRNEDLPIAESSGQALCGEAALNMSLGLSIGPTGDTLIRVK